MKVNLKLPARGLMVEHSCKDDPNLLQHMVCPCLDSSLVLKGMDAFEYLNNRYFGLEWIFVWWFFPENKNNRWGGCHKIKAYLKNREQHWKDSDELKCNSCYEQGSTYEVLFIVFSNSLHF